MLSAPRGPATSRIFAFRLRFINSSAAARRKAERSEGVRPELRCVGPLRRALVFTCKVRRISGRLQRERGRGAALCRVCTDGDSHEVKGRALCGSGNDVSAALWVLLRFTDAVLRVSVGPKAGSVLCSSQRQERSVFVEK